MSKDIKLSPKKNGKGYTTSYSVNIGSAEAKACGFITDTGDAVKLEKIIDADNNQIIIRIKPAD